MHHPLNSEVDSRIHRFLARKSEPRSLGRIIADRLVDGFRAPKATKAGPYQLLPLRRKRR